jgi:hypothetical protein
MTPVCEVVAAMGERGLTWFKAIAPFGIRLVSNVSVERRAIIACSSFGTLLKAIHLPSGDQLIIDIGAQVPGIRVERNSQAQMQLFELEPVVSEMIEEAESEHAPVHGPRKRSTKHPGRQGLPANLPLVERILPCTPAQRFCKRCGGETVVIGYEESSQLDVEPTKYFVLVTKREKRLAGRVRISACLDPVATPIVAQMDDLFAVDAEARRKALTTAARHVRRQETARALVDDIRSKIEAAQSVALPSNALSKACQYALTLWKKLTHFLG